MPMRHITKLSADDFRAAIGQTFRVPYGDETRLWVLRDVETHTLVMGSKSRESADGEKIPAKPALDKRTVTKLAKAAVDEINANLEAIGYRGSKLDKPITTVTLGFEGESGKTPLPECEYSLFHEGLGTIEGAVVSYTVQPVNDHSGTTPLQPLYDVTYQVK